MHVQVAKIDADVEAQRQKHIKRTKGSALYRLVFIRLVGVPCAKRARTNREASLAADYLENPRRLTHCVRVLQHTHAPPSHKTVCNNK